jgi:hypothetical protein
MTERSLEDALPGDELAVACSRVILRESGSDTPMAMLSNGCISCQASNERRRDERSPHSRPVAADGVAGTTDVSSHQTP